MSPLPSARHVKQEGSQSAEKAFLKVSCFMTYAVIAPLGGLPICKITKTQHHAITCYMIENVDYMKACYLSPCMLLVGITISQLALNTLALLTLGMCEAR